ncbi:MAG: fumarylacetoacetate hydrolase family protein [Chloroflexi bacterium]|nr:fumarylacetoacetate hydrolase family protein [Chloroflexota bacterium]
MRIVQFRITGEDDRLHVGWIEGDRVIEITHPASGLRSTLDLIQWADRERTDLTAAAQRLGAPGRSFPLAELDVAPGQADGAFLDLPLYPPEVWGCGVTYRKSAEFRDEETDRQRGLYDQVYTAARPEIFFKATASRCVGPNGEIGIRSDSSFTAPEPELAIVIGQDGRILAYTIANDVSAWDIERENPLYLPQSKIFQGCCALGPALVTPDEVPDPYALTVIARIRRGERLLFEDRVETSRIKRRLEELIIYLRRDNPIPAGTVVLTGTGIIVSAEHALRDGDIVEIEIPGLGQLRNVARRLG